LTLTIIFKTVGYFFDGLMSDRFLANSEQQFRGEHTPPPLCRPSIRAFLPVHKDFSDLTLECVNTFLEILVLNICLFLIKLSITGFLIYQYFKKLHTQLRQPIAFAFGVFFSLTQPTNPLLPTNPSTSSRPSTLAQTQPPQAF